MTQRRTRKGTKREETRALDLSLFERDGKNKGLDSSLLREDGRNKGTDGSRIWSFFDDWPGDSVQSEMVGSGVDGPKVLGAWFIVFLAWLTACLLPRNFLTRC